MLENNFGYHIFLYNLLTPLRLVEDYQFYFYERNSVIGVAFIVFPVQNFKNFPWCRSQCLDHSAYRSFKVNDDMTSNNADIIDFNFEKKEIKHKNVENRWRYSVQTRKEKKNGDVRLCTCLRRGSNPRFILRRKLIVNFWSSNVLSLTFHLHLWIMSYWYLLVNCCSSYKLFVLVNLHQRSTNWLYILN